MGRKCSRDRRLLCALCGGLLRRAPMQDRDMCTGLQLVLSVDDDLLVGLEARIDERLTLADLPDLDCADRYGAVRIDHIRVGALRALLHDRCRNCQAVTPDIEEESCINKLTRPQQVFVIWKLGSQPDRTGGLD